MKHEIIKIITMTGELEYKVEIPETEEEYCAGLAGRESIPEKTGMLYFADKFKMYPGELMMYTKDTLVPVDFIFLDLCGNILEISRNCAPLSEELYSCDKNVACLEIAAGEADRFGIREGDIVCHKNLHYPKDYAKLTVDVATEYFCFNRKVFAVKNGTIFNYSYKNHAWHSFPFLDYNSIARWILHYDEKYNKNKKEILKESEVESFILSNEKDFREDYFKTKEKFYILRNELLWKHSEIDGTYYLYDWLLGWEKIHHINREDFFKIFANRITSEEVNKIIAERSKRSVEINERENCLNRFQLGIEKPTEYQYSVSFEATVFRYNFALLICDTWKYGDCWGENWRSFKNLKVWNEYLYSKKISEEEAKKIIREYEENCSISAKQANIYFSDYKPKLDEFEDDIFSSEEWSAKTYKEYSKAKEYIEAVNLKGKKIKNIYFVGHDYNHSVDFIEEQVYNNLQNKTEEERQKLSQYDNIPQDFSFPVTAEIDEPLVLELDDGRTFEILFEDCTAYPYELRMSVNKISVSMIEPGINCRNVEANSLFPNIIERTIADVELNNEEDENSVQSVILKFDNSEYLEISGYVDFTWVENCDTKGNILTLPFGTLKEGLYNWEDLHNDSKVNFYADSSMFFVGNKGKERSEYGSFELFPLNNKNCERLIISDKNFTPFCFAIYCVVKVNNKYPEEVLCDYKQWQNILEKVEEFLNCKTFNELVYHLDKNLNNSNGRGGYSRAYIKNNAKDFWEKRKEFKIMLADIKKWTKLVLSPDDKMQVIGF